MYHTEQGISNSVIHIDCHEPRLKQVKRIMAAFPQDMVSFFSYPFERGEKSLSPDIRQNVSRISHCTREKIALILSAQLLDKKGSEELLNDIKLFHQQVLILLYTCLEEKEVRKKYKDLFSVICEPVVYVEYDAEKMDVLPTFPMGDAVLRGRLHHFLFPEKT